MKKDGQEFLEQLSGYPPHSFENVFSQTWARIGLGRALKRNELRLLCRAAFMAALCNIAMNRAGDFRGRMNPACEANRMRLELAFMVARDQFLSTTGWKNLPAAKRGVIRRMFLQVRVRPENLVP